MKPIFSNQDLQYGLDYHDPESRVFPRIRNKIATDQALNNIDILHILKWKLGRLKKTDNAIISQANLITINEAVRNAGIGKELEALESLATISGIKLAVATTILTVCYPKQFSIIDFRVLEILGFKKDTTDKWTAKEYIDKFMPAVREQCEKWKCELRETDKALWGLSVKAIADDIIRDAP